MLAMAPGRTCLRSVVRARAHECVCACVRVYVCMRARMCVCVSAREQECVYILMMLSSMPNYKFLLDFLNHYTLKQNRIRIKGWL